MQWNKEKKRQRLSFRKALLIVFIILLANAGVFFYKINKGFNLTGLSITETIMNLYENIPPNTKMFLSAQWVILILLLLFIFFKRKITDTGDDLEGIDLERILRGSETDIDTLYNLLKEKKHLRLSTIAKVFKVSSDVVIEWCKILEARDLVIIEYPSSKEAIVKINEEEEAI